MGQKPVQAFQDPLLMWSSELADAQASGACGDNPVGVQIPPSAPSVALRGRRGPKVEVRLPLPRPPMS